MENDSTQGNLHPPPILLPIKFALHQYSRLLHDHWNTSFPSPEFSCFFQGLDHTHPDLSPNYVSIHLVAHTKISEKYSSTKQDHLFYGPYLDCQILKLEASMQIDDLHVRLTFNLGKTKKIFYCS